VTNSPPAVLQLWFSRWGPSTTLLGLNATAWWSSRGYGAPTCRHRPRTWADDLAQLSSTSLRIREGGDAFDLLGRTLQKPFPKLFAWLVFQAAKPGRLLD